MGPPRMTKRKRDRWMDDQIDEQMETMIHVWPDEHTKGWMDGQMGVLRAQYIYIYVYI